MTADAAEPGIRVLLADDDDAQRAGWRLAIDSQPDLEVVAEAVDGDQVVAVLRRQKVDVAVIDAHMFGAGGIEATERVRSDAHIRLQQRRPVTRVVVVTAVDIDLVETAALAAGADAVHWKDVEPEVLFATLRALGRPALPAV